ncbi:hypothetical protein [Apilactobacillus xinyiensis]|uniref:hypothetical protein n=1 Tax=Apilactobacillus xinyiensis TaxID=2841032 RepID=UPI003364F20D
MSKKKNFVNIFSKYNMIIIDIFFLILNCLLLNTFRTFVKCMPTILIIMIICFIILLAIIIYCLFKKIYTTVLTMAIIYLLLTVMLMSSLFIDKFVAFSIDEFIILCLVVITLLFSVFVSIDVIILDSVFYKQKNYKENYKRTICSIKLLSAISIFMFVVLIESINSKYVMTISFITTVCMLISSPENFVNIFSKYNFLKKEDIKESVVKFFNRIKLVIYIFTFSWNLEAIFLDDVLKGTNNTKNAIFLFLQKLVPNSSIELIKFNLVFIVFMIIFLFFIIVSFLLRNICDNCINLIKKNETTVYKKHFNNQNYKL